MSLDDLLREVIASGRLNEPFTAADAARAVSLEEWTLPRVQSFLVRHCIGNLAATTVVVERVAFGKYRLICDGPRDRVARFVEGPGRRNGSHPEERPISPGDPES